jgi:hypothetical protein
VDILILAVLLATVIAVYRGARPRVILILWVVALLATLVLFRIHVTSALDLSF